MEEYHEYECEDFENCDGCDWFDDKEDCDDYVMHEKEKTARLIVKKAALQEWQTLEDSEQIFFLFAYGYHLLKERNDACSDLILKEKIINYNNLEDDYIDYEEVEIASLVIERNYKDSHQKFYAIFDKSMGKLKKQLLEKLDSL